MRSSLRSYRSLIFCASSIFCLANYAALSQLQLHGPRVIAPPQTSHRLSIRFEGEQPRPLAMVSGDFDEDGVADLVIGYGMEKGGSFALLRGNREAIAPQTRESWLAFGRHEYTDPFLVPVKPIRVKVQPGLMVSADLNGDGHLDLVYATRGGSHLSVMLGDGKGNFQTPINATVPGRITALAAYRPGAPILGEALVVGYESGRTGRVGIMSLGTSGLAMNAAYKLPAAPSMFAVENLDADFIPDTAMVAGGQLLVLHGLYAINGRGQLDTLPFTGVESVTSGQFLFDRHAQNQLSLLTSSGEVMILAHQGFDPQPYTPSEIAAARRAAIQPKLGTPSLAQQAGNNGGAPWIQVESESEALTGGLGVNPPILLRSRWSGSGGDDLLVLDPSNQKQTAIRHIGGTQSLAAREHPELAGGMSGQKRVNVNAIGSENLVSALSMRLSADGRSGVVMLFSDRPSPEFTVPSAGNTYFVNTTADNTGTTTDPDNGVRCTEGSGQTCTLRDAITFVNNDATDNINQGKSDTIMLPAGTYGLTWQAGTFDANDNAVTHLELIGPVTIMGASTSTTIIDGKNNDTVFTINPGPFGFENPSGDSYVFDTTIENLTIQNGKNNNNPGNSNTGFSNDVGGGLNWDAFGTGNLTLSSVTVQNNSILWGAGGGIWAFNSAGGGNGTVTLTGGIVSNNSTSESGGGLYEANAPSALTATNTVFSGNKAALSVNTSDPGAIGDAGGLYFSPRQGSPATPQSVLNGVSITSNTSIEISSFTTDNTVGGGGVETNSGILIENSLINSNSSNSYGGGVFSFISSGESAPTITSTNVLTNSATNTGGGLYVSTGTGSSGTYLDVTLSRIVGNTSEDGVTGLATLSPAKAMATENWWGCNAGPGNNGCDAADAGATTSPNAQFLLSSNTTNIALGGSIDLTLTLNTNSASLPIVGAFPAVATNYPYTLSVSGVTATLPGSGTLDTTGTGTATLTPTSSGNGTVSAKFDNQTDSLSFMVGSVSTSLQLMVAPSTTYAYGQAPSVTVQFNPSSASGITASNFQVFLDGTLSSAFVLTSLGSNLFQITGPFNVLAPAVHSFEVQFPATTDYATSSTTTSLTVTLGTVTISGILTPAKPIQRQGATVDVSVVGTGTGATPTGTVAYAFDGGTLSSVTLSSGAAVINLPLTISPGDHSLSLSYTGDANYGAASTTVSFTVLGVSETTITSLTATTATIDVFGFGFTPPSGQLAFNDVTSANPVAAPVTLNTAIATTSFTPQTTTSTGANTLPDWTTLVDVNGDGILDLITSLYMTDSVSVQLGNGDGTFQAASTYLIATGFGPAEIHAMSLSGNGNQDLIVGSFNTNQIAVLLGNTNGTFESPTFYTVGSATNTPTSLTTGDFNHDGNLDVAVANKGDNTVSILLGNGSGSLTVQAPISVGLDPEAIRAGDFNNDGYSDLAVANHHDGTVTILVNNQDGTFITSDLPVGSISNSGPQALAISGSGSSLLLAVANSYDNSVSVFHSNGNGTFAPQTIIPVGKWPDDLTFADFNGDGIPDLVVVNYNDNSVNLLIGSAGGSYSVLGPFSVGTGPYSAAVGDIDLDGTPDLIVSNCLDNNTGELLGGTMIAVPYSGLSLAAGHTLDATYTPDNNSKYGASTSPNVTAP